jgi:5-bromo-4-chloroindolyl phosphate hydrolysis protein
MKFSKRARTADIIYGTLVILGALMLVGLFLVAAVLNAVGGFVEAIFGFSLLGVVTAVGSATQVITFGIMFGVVWTYIGVKALLRAERSGRYVRTFGKYPMLRVKLSQVAGDFGRSLKYVSADLNAMKSLGYFPNMSFDLQNKEVVFESASEPLALIGDESKTVLERKRGFPVDSVIAAVVTAMAFGFGFWGIVMGVGGFFLVFLFFPLPTYFREVMRTAPAMKKPVATGNEDLDNALASIYDNKKEMIRVSREISSMKILRSLREILRMLDLIAEFVTDNPEKVKSLRQFVNYYLPTTVSFLQTYEELEKKTDKGENITCTLAKIEETTANLVGVFKREYDDLFSDKAMDIEAEAAVMKALIKESEDIL